MVENERRWCVILFWVTDELGAAHTALSAVCLRRLRLTSLTAHSPTVCSSRRPGSGALSAPLPTPPLRSPDPACRWRGCCSDQSSAGPVGATGRGNITAAALRKHENLVYDDLGKSAVSHHVEGTLFVVASPLPGSFRWDRCISALPNAAFIILPPRCPLVEWPPAVSSEGRMKSGPSPT